MVAKHYVIASCPAWGHIRPEISLTLNLLELHSEVSITLLIPDFRREQVLGELKAFQIASPSSFERLRLVIFTVKEFPSDFSLADGDTGGIIEWSQWLGTNFEEDFRKVLKVSRRWNFLFLHV